MCRIRKKRFKATIIHKCSIYLWMFTEKKIHKLTTTRTVEWSFPCRKKTFSRIVVSWGKKSAKNDKQLLVKELLLVGFFFFVCGGGRVGLVFFLAKRKPENRGGEGPVLLLLLKFCYFFNWAIQSFICTGISRTWLKYCLIFVKATISKEFILKISSLQCIFYSFI